MNPVKTWLCRLVCCGRDDGVVECESWEQADAFREAYTSGVGVALHGYSAPLYESGHRRAVIVTQDDCREAARHIVEHKAEVAALRQRLAEMTRKRDALFEEATAMGRRWAALKAWVDYDGPYAYMPVLLHEMARLELAPPETAKGEL